MLTKELNNVRAKWYNIGLQLGVNVGTLKAIEKQYLNDPTDCLRETLTTWLTELCLPSPPTWTNVVDALNVVGEARLATDLKQKYYLSIPVSHTSVTVQPSPPQLQTSVTTFPPHPIVPLLPSRPITHDSPDAPSTPQHSSPPHSPTPTHTGKSLVAISFLAIAVSIQAHCLFPWLIC